ncbi:hypothetical protein [Burkholderia sp. YIM B11467]
MTIAGLDSQRIQAGDLFDAITPHGMRRPFPNPGTGVRGFNMSSLKSGDIPAGESLILPIPDPARE